MNMDFGYNKLHKWRANNKVVVWANFVENKLPTTNMVMY